MDKDSQMDLDDCAAGHPIAMYELKELRSEVGRLRGALERLLAVAEKRGRVTAYVAAMCYIARAALAPAAEEPGHWDGTPCNGKTPTLAACPRCPRKPPEGEPAEGFEEFHRITGNCPDPYLCGRDSGAPWWGYGSRWEGKSCREVYESSHPATARAPYNQKGSV